jgi:recombinational DNA repair protein (RecF pathway)
MPEPVTTDVIVLRKTPYGDSRAIITGISPNHGQVGFMVPNPLPGSRSSFPHLDLFRLVTISYRPSGGKLHTCQDADLLQDFSALTRTYASFQAACWLAKFTLANVLPETAHPHYFHALTIALGRLAAASVPPVSVLTGASVAFLFEEGWLDAVQQSEQVMEQCRQLLLMSAGAPPPRLTPSCWEQLFAWACQLLAQAECMVPQSS